MNRRAQAGPLALIILLLMFIVMWFIWLGSYLAEIGQSTVDVNHLSGIEAFAFSNLNIIVLVGVILGFIGFMVWSGGAR